MKFYLYKTRVGQHVSQFMLSHVGKELRQKRNAVLFPPRYFVLRDNIEKINLKLKPEVTKIDYKEDKEAREYITNYIQQNGNAYSDDLYKSVVQEFLPAKKETPEEETTKNTAKNTTKK